MRYAHTNIIALDWRRLAAFYEEVFACVPVPPRRAQAGEWLARGTGVPGAALEGVHLRLPGHGALGPTLEIYAYEHTEPLPPGGANRRGLGHLAFEVDDVEQTARTLCEHGGSLAGEITARHIDGVGDLVFVYARDPEGNLIELQSWGQPASSPDRT